MWDAGFQSGKRHITVWFQNLLNFHPQDSKNVLKKQTIVNETQHRLQGVKLKVDVPLNTTQTNKQTSHIPPPTVVLWTYRITIPADPTYFVDRLHLPAAFDDDVESFVDYLVNLQTLYHFYLPRLQFLPLSFLRMYHLGIQRLISFQAVRFYLQLLSILIDSWH